VFACLKGPWALSKPTFSNLSFDLDVQQQIECHQLIANSHSTIAKRKNIAHGLLWLIQSHKKMNSCKP
jgi:hypothetical protein